MAINSAELRRRVGILDGFYKWIERGSTFCFRKKSRNDGVGSATRSARNDETLMARILSLPPIVFIGKISYSLYLWHWIIIVFYKRWHSLYFDPPFAPTDYVIIISLSLIAATISYYAIERPCRFSGLNLKRSALLFYVTPALIISVVFVAHKIGPKDFYGYFDKNLVARHELHAKLRTYGGNERMCHGKIIINENGDECVFGDLSKKPRAIMIGDSHGGHYAPIVAKAGEMYGFSVKIRTSPGCVSFWDKTKYPREYGKACADVIDDFWASVDKFDIVIIAQYWGSNGRFYNHLESELAHMLEALHGKKIVLVAQVPNLHQYLHDRYLYRLMDGKIRHNENFLSGEEAARETLVRSLAHGRAIWFNPLDDLDETTKVSFPFYNGLIMYTDNNHLNDLGVERIMKEALPKQKEFWEGLLR